MSEFFKTPARASDESGDSYSGAIWYFYLTGTSTPATVYADANLTTPLGTTVTADAGGKFADIYLDSAVSYRAVLKNASGSDTVYDIDPYNPSSADGAYITVGSYGTLDPTGVVDNTAIFDAAYAAAAAASKPLLVPAGTYKVAWVLNEDGPDVKGVGPDFTVFVPTGNNTTVIRVNRSTSANRLRSCNIEGFSIDLSGRTGCKGLYTKWLISSVISRVSIIGDEHPTFTGNNIGWDSEGDQYSTFRDIKIERVYCAHYFHDGGASVGGGINNNFANFHFGLCMLGSVQVGASVNPMGYNTFENFWGQSTSHCALYINNVQAQSFSNFPPEACSGSGTLVFQGYTIKAGHIHATNNAQARFDNYSHVSNNTAMVIRAEDQSRLAFVNSTGAAVRTTADDTSTIDWEGTWGHSSVFLNTQVRPHHIETGRALVATEEARIVPDGSFPTAADRGSAITGLVTNNNGLAAGPTINGDTGMTAYQSVTFGAGVGGSGTNWFRIGMTVGSSVDRTVLNAAAILLRSATDADYVVSFSNIVQGVTVSLTAGEWTRVVLADGFQSGTTFGYIDIWPLIAGGPTLDFAYPTIASGLSARNFARFIDEHVVNPRDPRGLVYSAAAAPVAGTWQLGAIVWNSAPAAGGTPGWVCVTAGTPGTWKAMANLAV